MLECASAGSAHGCGLPSRLWLLNLGAGQALHTVQTSPTAPGALKPVALEATEISSGGGQNQYLPLWTQNSN